MTGWDGVVGRLQAVRVVPVVTVDDQGRAEQAARALAAGGLSCVEIAFRTDAAADALGRVAALDGVLAGAGTVLSADQARAARDAGAAFAVAPGLNEDVVDACAALGLPFFPGVATPSEIERARALGLAVVKVFPAAQLGGPGFLRAVSATYPDVSFLPTGGITADTLGDYLAVPSVLACGGSWMVQADLLREGRFDEVERLAREAVEAAA
jgi:2-dehydro-3-deoxyphosphogluconate aldolase/(4S)-4-hydroxy-2-oxoglutarate aldolase